MAVRQYGSIEKYTAAMKERISHFSENTERLQKLKENGYVEKNKYFTEELVKDITRDTKSKEIQNIVNELVNLVGDALPDIDMGENYWNMVINGYLQNKKIIEATDKMYGPGAAEFMGKALQYYFDNR